VNMQLRVLVAALAVLGASGCAAQGQVPVAQGASGTAAKDASSVDGFLPASTHDHPCRVGGQRLGTAVWAEEAPAVVGVPSTALASQQNLESVWVCGGSNTVLTYPHLTVTFEPGWSQQDQTSNWQAMVRDWGVGTVETVDGYPAYVAGASKITPRGELLFVVDGTLVRIIGNGELTADDLMTVGNSLRPA
jgi:hypothetical protein